MSITQIEDTYHRFLKSDDQYGAAVDGYGRAPWASSRRRQHP